MSKTVTLPAVQQLSRTSLATFAICDVLVHGWDLATATGPPRELDPELATAVP